jgi:hypothetical protein
VQADDLTHVRAPVAELIFLPMAPLEFSRLPSQSASFYMPILSIMSALETAGLGVPSTSSAVRWAHDVIVDAHSQLLRLQLCCAAIRAARIILEQPEYFASIASSYRGFGTLCTKMFEQAQCIAPIHSRYTVPDMQQTMLAFSLDKLDSKKLKSLLSVIGYNEPWAVEAISAVENKVFSFSA